MSRDDRMPSDRKLAWLAVDDPELTSTALNWQSRSGRSDPCWRCYADGAPGLIEARAPTDDAQHALQQTIIARHREDALSPRVLVEVMSQTYLADLNAEGDGDEAHMLQPLQAAAVTYRIALTEFADLPSIRSSINVRMLVGRPSPLLSGPKFRALMDHAVIVACRLTTEGNMTQKGGWKGAVG